MLGLDMTSRLIRLGHSDCLSDQVRAKVTCFWSHQPLAGSMTAQPPGSHTSILQVATHGQQVTPVMGSYSSADVLSAYSTAPAFHQCDLLHVNKVIFKEICLALMLIFIYWMSFIFGKLFIWIKKEVWTKINLKAEAQILVRKNKRFQIDKRFSLHLFLSLPLVLSLLLFLYIYACMCMFTYAFIHVCACIYIYIYIDIQIYTRCRHFSYGYLKLS